MATPKIATRDDWIARAIELAEHYHLTYTARYLDAHTYIVPSRDRSSHHRVTITHGHPVCDCAASAYGCPCCHVGAVLHAECIRGRAHDDAFGMFKLTGEW